ncbi:MAG: transposase [Dehalococcoidia bacterium]|nr:MAG: transposase [Dehalococcoidia bacterium]
MPYWRLVYHIVWSTRGREPLLDGEDERIVERSVRTTLRSFGAIAHAVGVMPDHVHVAASIPSSIPLSEVVGRMKGAAAHALNHTAPRSREVPFAWQGEYGVLSFGERALPDVIAYVRNQREHHAAQRLWPSLERMAEQAGTAAAGGR